MARGGGNKEQSRRALAGANHHEPRKSGLRATGLRSRPVPSTIRGGPLIPGCGGDGAVLAV